MKDSISPQVKKFFWGDDLTQLQWPEHKKYITQTLLEKGDRNAIKWLFHLIDKPELNKLLPSLKLSSKSRSFLEALFVMTSHFFLETLPSQTDQLAKLLHQRKPPFLEQFYLSGGTALALQIGHRESEDLDFFSEASFLPEQLQNALTEFGQLEETELAQGTVNTFINGVKLQFLEYPYPLIEPFTDWGGIKLSSILDIACTKLHTISIRGSKKDFIDLYFLLEIYSLPFIFEALEKKYQKISYNYLHILKSLIYFEDAEQQPVPRMHKEVSWEEVKKIIIQNVKAVTI